MTKTEGPAVLLAFASWEERFLGGLLEDLRVVECSEVLVFYFSSYSDQTHEPRTGAREECLARELRYDEVELDAGRPHDNLRLVDAAIARFDSSSPFVVDISTMPREIIWYVFWLSEDRKAPLRYRYYSPSSYADDWLSRDPGRPRLVHKLSGIALPQAKTILLVVVGYDIQRVWQLIRFFEPSKLVVALQTDSPFSANDKVMQRYVEELRVGEACSTFEMDAFQEDHGYAAFEHQLADFVDEYNIILSSLGPKLTAVSLYRIQRRWPQVGLVYAPANEFNVDYSQGIGRAFQGVLEEKSA